MLKRFTLLMAFLGLSTLLNAQIKIGDNAATVNPNALLELESTNKALLLPRLSQAQIDGMQNVPAGMLVYNNTTNAINIRTNSSWVTLVQAANAASADSPWNRLASVAYTTVSKVGIGTSQPYSQLANTSVNTIGSDEYGGNPNSFSWAATQLGYVGQFYNGGASSNFNGLAVKVNANNATALDVSQGPQTSPGQPLLIVKSTGNVGIRTSSPQEALEVNGNIKYSGNLQMGLTYPYNEAMMPANTYAFLTVSCPQGTRQIGGGGGVRDINTAFANLIVTYSGPDKDDTNRWLIVCTNKNSVSTPIRVYAICAKVQ